MKWVGILFLLLLIGACKDETRENLPLKGDYFVRANPWKFYFITEEGKGKITLEPGAALPTTDMKNPGDFQQAYVPEDYTGNHMLYNHNSNSVGFDEEKGLYYWMTSVPGNEYITENEFYVHFSPADIDTIRVNFKFIYEEVIGGDFAVNITELYYNGLLVIKNDDYVNPDGIFIEKTEN